FPVEKKRQAICALGSLGTFLVFSKSHSLLSDLSLAYNSPSAFALAAFRVTALAGNEQASKPSERLRPPPSSSPSWHEGPSLPQCTSPFATMVSIEPPFELLDRHIKPERDYRYPGPAQAAFDIPAQALAFSQDPIAYDSATLYPDNPLGCSSPAAALVDERSSNLSPASAASSAVGSPRSSH